MPVKTESSKQNKPPLSSLLWGTYGKYRELRLTWKPVTDLATDHIIAILVTQLPIPNTYAEAFIEILKSRGYTWIGGKHQWYFGDLHPHFHSKEWFKKGRSTHHPYPSDMTPEENEAERKAKEEFHRLLFQRIDGPMFHTT